MRKIFISAAIALAILGTSCNTLKNVSNDSSEETTDEELTAEEPGTNYFSAEPTATDDNTEGEDEEVALEDNETPKEQEANEKTETPVETTTATNTDSAKEEVVKVTTSNPKPSKEAMHKISMLTEKFTFVEKKDEVKNNDGKYFVILGSFGMRYNADRFKKQLSQEGFKPFILLSETGNMRICINSYDDEAKARERVVSIRKNYTKYFDAWLLKKNK